MLMMNIIFAVSFGPIWPILYFVFRNLVKPKKNLIIGVTIPQTEYENPQVLEVCRAYLKSLNIVMLPLLPLMIIPFFTNSMGIAMTLFMTLFVPLVIAPMVVFAIYHGKLMTVKRENGWIGETAGKTLIDIKAAALPINRISGIWFFIPTIISFIPVAESLINQNTTGPNLFWMYTTFALITASFWLFYNMIFRVRTEAINENLTLTMALTRVRRYNWNKFWIISVWLTCALNISLRIFYENMAINLGVTLIYSLVLMVIAMKAEFSTRLAQQKLTATDLGDVYIDEDDYWLWGQLYYNPNDDHFLVNARIGMNMSVNLAKTGGKILMIFAALSIVAMPFIGIWILVEEKTPTAIMLTDTVIVARHTKNQYTIPLNDIESIELLEEMPRILSRDMGSSFDHLAKGRFTVLSHSTSYLCIQTNTPPFILITTADNTYFINDANSSVTTGIYNQITSGRYSN